MSNATAIINDWEIKACKGYQYLGISVKRGRPKTDWKEKLRRAMSGRDL